MPPITRPMHWMRPPRSVRCRRPGLGGRPATPHLPCQTSSACSAACSPGAPRQRRVQPDAAARTPRWPPPLAGDDAAPWRRLDGACRRAWHRVLDLAWGLLTPVHWHLGRDEDLLTDPNPCNSRKPRARCSTRCASCSTRRLRARLGRRVPLVRRARVFADCPPPLDRVVGRNVDRWLPDRPRARLLRRLQNESADAAVHAPDQRGARTRGLLP